MSGVGLDDPTTALPGVGPAIAEALAEDLDVHTVGGLVLHWPSRHREPGELMDAEDASADERATVVGTVLRWDRREVRRRRRLVITEALVRTATGAEFTATWFNQPQHQRRLPVGTRAAFSGKVEHYRGRVQLKNPDVEPIDDDEEPELDLRLQPTYPGSGRLPTHRVARLVDTALEALGELPEWQDEVVLARHGLLGFDAAVRSMHRPDDREALEEARRRLAFDELFLLQLGLRWRRARLEADVAGLVNRVHPDGLARAYLDALPFEPTRAQRRAFDEVAGDLVDPLPMHRLLQGDVGSGKTLVAAWTMLCAVDNGRQAALMAPTEVLAEQHHRTLLQQLEPLGVNMLDGPRVELLTGSTTATEQRRILAGLMSGEVDAVVGTHALLEERVAFADLGVVVIDEQHRFGVDQRTTLADKRALLDDTPTVPDVLVMTATPIPRSLALTVYGDLDVSVIDELPPGRQPVVTQLITPAQAERRGRLEAFVRERAAAGEQVYWVCSLVEPSDAIAAESASECHQRLSTGPFRDLRVGLVHGQMPSSRKDEAMGAFRAGELDVLVATTVVEVGVDVPRATIMVVEDAERFGMSQLHQLRGRVGRGDQQSYCVLFAGWNAELAPESQARLRAIADTADGFELAERDLAMRGAGTLFGTRQHGLPDLRLALLSDTRLMALAADEAGRVVERDPDVEQHPSLRAEVRRRHAGVEAFAALASG